MTSCWPSWKAYDYADSGGHASPSQPLTPLSIRHNQEVGILLCRARHSTESISIAVRNDAGKIVMECVIEAKASTLLQFIDGLRGDLRVTFEEGTWAAWLYDLLKPHVTEVWVCNTRENTSTGGRKSDRIDARKLSEQLYMNNIKSVYHGEHGSRTLKEVARSYLTISKDLTALYRSWGIPCAGKEVYASRTARNGSARSAKRACGAAPNTTTSSWMSCGSCARRYAGPPSPLRTS
jgi:hypothetical protein